MEFFCYHRDRPGSVGLRHELIEEHWSYMDRFAKELIARGPTFDADGELSGSVHIVELPDPAAARAFAFDEPCWQAGAYRDVLVRRWRNLLGRTMWDFPGGRTGEDRYLVLGFGSGEPADLDVPSGARTDGDADDGADPDADLIAFGPLLADDGGAWLGTAALVRATGPDAARDVLTSEPYDAVEVHAWEFGGRR
ncbi:YciI family protein [Actinomadura sp. WMMB 499]|uniref:YciI family protein n=1 Tax=Actinomadura sp. WMMB 499 TaxID=1219491 RepID=UPI001245E5B8|nr:YciI family protein [Actinomadura sp. WMMB 499]QFG21488.1 YciI family protein [Actinomadura sp. WMMB 499]